LPTDNREIGSDFKPAPRISPDMHAIYRPTGREIRECHFVDPRFASEDIAKPTLHGK
jgi:hypothetical protein